MTTTNLDLLLANCPTDAECDAAIAQLALHAQLHAEGWSLEALDDAADRCEDLSDWRPFLAAFWRGARNGDALRAERRAFVRTTAAGRYETTPCDIDPFRISSWTETSRCGDEADECLAGAALSRAAVRTFDTHCAAEPARCATAPAPRPTPPVSPDPAPAPKKTRPAAPASAAARLEAAREALAKAEAKAAKTAPVEVRFTNLEGTVALVPSSDGARVYTVSLRDGIAYGCGCEGNAIWARQCWHMRAAEAAYRACDAQPGAVLRCQVARPQKARKPASKAALVAA